MKRPYVGVGDSLSPRQPRRMRGGQAVPHSGMSWPCRLIMVAVLYGIGLAPLLDTNPAEPTTVDPIAHRIDELRRELEIARETNNEAEIREILELLERLGVEPTELDDGLPEGPLVAPHGVRAIGSYGMNILRWQASPTKNLKGFSIVRSADEQMNWDTVATLPPSRRKWMDTDAIPHQRYAYRLCAVGHDVERTPFSSIQSATARDPVESSLPTYSLTLPQNGIRAMLADVVEDIDVDGQFDYEGRQYPIRVRLRGASTRHAEKKSYRIQFLEGTPLTRRVTYLKAEPMDYTMQQEKLSCDLFQAADLWVSETRYINLFINDRYEGVYLDIEPIRSPFKTKPGLAPEGTLIRARTFQHLAGWQGLGELRGQSGSLPELREFITRINRVDRGDFESFVRTAIDWPRVRDYLALQIICHRSEIEADDFFFYRDPASRQWSFIPWDHNNGNFAVVAYGNGIAEPSIHLFSQCIQDLGWRPNHWFVLPSRIYNNERLRAEFLGRLRELTQRLLLSGPANEFIENNFDHLHPEYPIDPYRTPFQQEDPFLSSDRDLKQFVTVHATRILEQIDLCENRPSTPLVINEFKIESESSWVELHNQSEQAISLNDVALVTKEDRGNWRYPLPEGAVVEPKGYGVFEIPTKTIPRSNFRTAEQEERRRFLNRNSETGPSRFPGFDPDGGFIGLVQSPKRPDREPRERDYDDDLTQVLDFYFYGPQRGEYSYGRLNGEFTWLQPTPRHRNSSRRR